MELCRNYLEDIPVKSEDHIAYIARAFPEFFMLEDPDLNAERDWSGDLAGSVNIYGGPRSSHDRKCLSTRVRPIGDYPCRYPVNFKKFQPPPDWPSDRASQEPIHTEEQNNKLPSITNPYTFMTASPNVGGFSKLHKKDPKNKKRNVRRGSMMGQTGASLARQLNFKLPTIKL